MKNCMLKHGGVHKSCLVRQVNKEVRITISEAGCIMNRKSEFHQAPLVRVVPTTGLLEEQGREGGGEGRGGQGRGSSVGRSSRGGRGRRIRGGGTS